MLRERLYGTGDGALDLGQIDTLDTLVQREGWRMADLAEAMRVDASTATRAVARLVAAGLAARSASSSDARCVVVAATPDGRARHALIAERRRSAITEILAGFEPEEQATLAELMERLVAGLDEWTARPTLPATDPTVAPVSA